MKNLYKLISIIVLGLFLNGCGTYYVASEYSDPNYIVAEDKEAVDWTGTTQGEYAWNTNFYYFSRGFNYDRWDWQWRWYNVYSYGGDWNS